MMLHFYNFVVLLYYVRKGLEQAATYTVAEERTQDNEHAIPRSGVAFWAFLSFTVTVRTLGERACTPCHSDPSTTAPSSRKRATDFSGKADTTVARKPLCNLKCWLDKQHIFMQPRERANSPPQRTMPLKSIVGALHSIRWQVNPTRLLRRTAKLPPDRARPLAKGASPLTCCESQLANV